MRYNSAKRERDEITPQSEYVIIRPSGWCVWVPSPLWTVSHCAIDSTWFPFDEQHCDLIYEPWRYSSEQLNLTTHWEGSYPAVDYEPSDEWDLIGKFFLHLGPQSVHYLGRNVVILETRSSADADNRLDAFSG